MNLNTSFKKYGIGEIILALVGIVFLINVTVEVISRPWEEFTMPIIGVMVLFLSLGSLLLMAPLTILDMARKKLGLETKK